MTIRTRRRDTTADAWLDVIERLDRIEALLRSRTGARDEADRALVPIIHDSTLGLPFSASALWQRAQAAPELKAALQACDLDNPIQVGRLLGRLAGIEIDDVVLDRVSEQRSGAVWCTRRLEK